MAAGDVTVFEEFVLSLGSETHDFANDVFKLGLIDAVVTPTAADATPRWGAGSGVDYDANEVSTAGGYTAGGETIGSTTWTEADGVATFDGANISLAQNGSGFTDARWGIIYNETATNNEAIAFVDLGAAISEQAGAVAINWSDSPSAIFTISD